MEKIRKVTLCYFFKRLDINPKDKIKELSDELKSVLDGQFVFNNEEINHLFSLPRVQALSNDKKVLFQMSLINANVFFTINEQDEDDVVLLINNNIQLFYDVLKEVYNIDIIYSSIKIESFEEKEKPATYLANKFNISEDLENFSINRGYTKDNYYINVIYNSSNEYNFDILGGANMSEQDLFDNTMITSLSEAKMGGKFIIKIIGINDRLAFNKDKDYLSSKENIRGMILELKKLLQNEKI